MSDKISARDLHLGFFHDPETFAGREYFVDDAWRTFVMADVQRRPDSPLYLYTDWPNGEFQVPYASEVPVRDRPGACSTG